MKPRFIYQRRVGDRVTSGVYHTPWFRIVEQIPTHARVGHVRLATRIWGRLWIQLLDHSFKNINQ